MKTAISVPDDVFAAAERLARRRKMSRSALYTEALRRLLDDSNADRDVTARLDEIYTEVESDVPTALLAAQADALREEW